MKSYKFEADKETLLKSKAFKEDDITRAIDELNETLFIAKCKGIILEVKDEHKGTESIVLVNGYALRSYTVAKLITAGVVRIKEVQGEDQDE